jgi:hypothetical protein
MGVVTAFARLLIPHKWENYQRDRNAKTLQRTRPLLNGFRLLEAANTTRTDLHSPLQDFSTGGNYLGHSYSIWFSHSQLMVPTTSGSAFQIDHQMAQTKLSERTSMGGLEKVSKVFRIIFRKIASTIRKVDKVK